VCVCVLCSVFWVLCSVFCVWYVLLRFWLLFLLLLWLFERVFVFHRSVVIYVRLCCVCLFVCVSCACLFVCVCVCVVRVSVLSTCFHSSLTHTHTYNTPHSALRRLETSDVEFPFVIIDEAAQVRACLCLFDDCFSLFLVFLFVLCLLLVFFCFPLLNTNKQEHN